MTIVRIGSATLYLGDAYEIRPQLGFFEADCMDPPYVFRADGGGQYRSHRPMMDRIKDEDLHKGFDHLILNPLLCGAAIVFSHNDQLADLLPYLKGSFDHHAVCVWQKVNPQPLANKHYRPDAEFYVHAWHHGYHPQGELIKKHRVRRISSPRGAARLTIPAPSPTS